MEKKRRSWPTVAAAWGILALFGAGAVAYDRGALDGLDILAPFLGSKEERLCKALVERHLKSPTSVSWVSSTLYRHDVLPSVRLKFDADNAFGASLRGTAECEFVAGSTPPKFESARLNDRQLSRSDIEAWNLLLAD